MLTSRERRRLGQLERELAALERELVSINANEGLTTNERQRALVLAMERQLTVHLELAALQRRAHS
jgi:hypothetical protein